MICFFVSIENIVINCKRCVLKVNGTMKVREGAEREGERERGRASKGGRVCVSLAVKQTLNSNQLSSRQLCRTKHDSCTRLYKILIKKESQRGREDSVF